MNRPDEIQELFTRVPPSSLQSEQCVLGAILLDNQAMCEAMEILLPADFYREGHRTVYRAMLDLFERNLPIDLITLTEELKRTDRLERSGGAVYVSSLPDLTPSAAHVGTYAKSISEKAILRDLISTSQKISARAYEEPADPDAFLDESEGAIFDIANRRSSGAGQVDVGDVLLSATKEIEQISSVGVIGIKTGLRDVDLKSYGFDRGDLDIIAGRPSTGKTALALQILLNAVLKQNLVGGIFSIEMGNVQLARRALTNLSDISIRPGVALSKIEWDAINYAANQMLDVKERLRMDGQATITPQQIRAKCRRWKARGGLDIAFIDYLQLISNSLSGRNRETEVADISRQMKALARELNIPVVVLSQLNRSVDSRSEKRPKLSDLRESGAIEQDADKVLFTWTDEKNNYYITVGKNRNGPTGDCQVNIKWSTGRFTDHETEYLDTRHDTDDKERP